VETVEVLEGNDLTDMEKRLERADLVVDGIFGTGLKGGVKGFRGNVIKLVNQKNKPVIAVDIPSGVDGETGEIEGECIKLTKQLLLAIPNSAISCIRM